MTEITLLKLRKILLFYFHENNATELYQLLTNFTQETNEDPQSFSMRALTIKQTIIGASKESDSGIKYDASSVQSLFLHALETGLAVETIRAKIRSLTQDPKVSDDDLIRVIILAISAETEGSNKFNPKGKFAEVFVVEGAAEGNEKKEQPKDQILAILKDVQADLAAVQSEVKTLHETANNQKADTISPSHARKSLSEPAHVVAKNVGGREKVTDTHITIFVVARTISHGTVTPVKRVIRETDRGYTGQRVTTPEREREKSHQRSGCLKFKCHKELLQCSACQSVRYCSVHCQKAHWPKHKVLCKATRNLLRKKLAKKRGWDTPKMGMCMQATSLPGNRSA